MSLLNKFGRNYYEGLSDMNKCDTWGRINMAFINGCVVPKSVRALCGMWCVCRERPLCFDGIACTFSEHFHQDFRRYQNIEGVGIRNPFVDEFLLKMEMKTRNKRPQVHGL